MNNKKMKKTPTRMKTISIHKCFTLSSQFVSSSSHIHCKQLAHFFSTASNEQAETGISRIHSHDGVAQSLLHRSRESLRDLTQEQHKMAKKGSEK